MVQLPHRETLCQNAQGDVHSITVQESNICALTTGQDVYQYNGTANFLPGFATDEQAKGPQMSVKGQEQRTLTLCQLATDEL